VIPLGRRKSTPQRVPSVQKPRKPRAQVRRNKSSGTNFENKMLQYFTEHLRSIDVEGWVYKLPDGRNCDQLIDLLIDSKDWGFCGIECKNIDESKLIKEKIYVKRLSRKSADYGHQFKKQHMFLKASGRYGILAIHFSAMDLTILVPHQYIYERIEAGAVFFTVTELLKNSYCINDGRGSLKLFIRNKCQVYDSD